MRTLRQQAARMIRSLMRDMRISDYLVMVPEGETSSAKALCEQLEGLHVGDGSGDAALAIAEHAFKAGYDLAAQRAVDYAPTVVRDWTAHREAAWSDYDPPEDIKALS
jgi:hypothetical protein